MSLLHGSMLALATWVVWEALSALLPWRFHAALQPVLVTCIALMLEAYLPYTLLTMIAVAGVVALLHVFSRACMPEPVRPAAHAVGKRRVQRVPDLPS